MKNREKQKRVRVKESKCERELGIVPDCISRLFTTRHFFKKILVSTLLSNAEISNLKLLTLRSVSDDPCGHPAVRIFRTLVGTYPRTKRDKENRQVQ